MVHKSERSAMAPIPAPKKDQKKKLRIGFIHPDLGLGRRFS